MFTGIIEELGIIHQLKQKGKTLRLTITSKIVIADISLGASISVNGVCLTVTSFTKTRFTVDVMPETFKVTNLQDVKVSERINLERAISAQGRFAGHFVTGHVDGIAIIKSIVPHENAVEYVIELANKNLCKYCIMRGSIAVDGISLTIFAINGNKITLALIPHTMKHSVLGYKKVGQMVNIECDMLVKTIVATQQSFPNEKEQERTLCNSIG